MRPTLTPTTRAALTALTTCALAASAVSCGDDPPGRSPGGTGGSSMEADSGVDGGGGGNIGSGGSVVGSGGATNPPDASTDAPIVIPDTCGDSVVDEGEECDDGNTDDQDGCRRNCRFTCTAGTRTERLCTDNIYCNGAEICLPDHTCAPGEPVADGLECGVNSICIDAVCSAAPDVCGDGRKFYDEECDDEDDPGCNPPGSENECRHVCRVAGPARPCVSDNPCLAQPTCNADTHTCEPGNALSDYTLCDPATNARCLDAECVTEYCSSGVVDDGEECDDGNRVDNDGCDADCQFTCVSTEPERNCVVDNPCADSGGCDDSTHLCNAPINKSNGTECGSDLICVFGNCLNSQCGDGIVSGAEECDDRNSTNNDGCNTDCTVSCQDPATDCGPAPDCQAWTCADNACVPVPDASQNGDDCDTGAGAATCNAGACTEGTCGDGVRDPGEQCDFGAANGINTGCEELCVSTCQNDSECNGCAGLVCRDVIFSGQESARCVQTVVPEEGSSCGTGRVCVGEECLLSFCGDGYTDTSVGEECDPPLEPFCDPECKARATCDLTGAWALKLVVDVTFGGNAVLLTGSGQVVQRVRADITQNSTALSVDVLPCGLITPDFKTDPGVLGGETFGLNFPNSLWESASIPVTEGIAGSVSGVAPGATFEMTSSSIIIGMTMGNPFLSPWPALADLSSNGITPTDDDENGIPGISANLKTGTAPGGEPYAFPPVDIADPNNIGRADRFDLIVRQISSQTGTVRTCDLINGTAQVTAINNHVISCRLTTGEPCADEQRDLADTVRPVFQPTGATFEMVRVDDDASCADIRAALP